MCVMCLWCGYGIKLYPCSPEYVMGTPAAIAARCCCCTPGGHPSTGIWYPVGMLMFLSKKKLPNPVCDAGIFPASQLFEFELRSNLLSLFIYTQLPACVCGGRVGRSLWYWLTATFKRPTAFTGNKSHQRSPPLFLLAFFAERLNTCYLMQHRDFGREPKFQFKCNHLFFLRGE